ncbi:MAG: nitroreductase family protein [Lachnospiraceae bacterium]|nr:nitroreductase family protein [Lachnospiraceae bacterium]
MAKKHSVLVNSDKCIGCGICEKDCVSGAIRLVDGKAQAKAVGCIYCGHCEAVCPKNAVTVTGFAEETVEFSEQTRLDPKTLMMAMKTRRTVRVFKEKEVSKKIIKQIIEAGRLAPTGGNAQNTGYVILGSKQKALEAVAVGMFNKVMGPAKKLVPFLKSMVIDENFFFKKAPLVIVITGSAVNASLAAENMAFMAEANGLGVLYSGFFTMCANHSSKIRKAMKLRLGEKVVTTLVIGYPGVKYYRTARREKARVRVL